MKLFSLILFLALSCLNSEKTMLNLNVANIKENKGVVRILIFSESEGFPEDVSQAVKSLSIPVSNFSASTQLTDLPPGKYAISIFHDVDNDGKLKKNTFGIPSEPYGFSNNPTLLFGAPSFSKCAFTLGSESKKIEISLK